MSSVDREPDRPPEAESLDDVLQRCLDREPSEWDSALEAACRERPDHAADLRSRFAALRSHGLTEEPAASPPRATLAGYEIRELLGGGGMGTVYAAIRCADGQRAAVKFLHPHLLTSAAARGRFQREIDLAARSDHPHLCKVIESGVLDGAPYIVMEHLSGSSLAEWIEPLRRSDLAPRDVEKVLVWAEQVAGALAALHASGLIHRDVKPGNVMITSDRAVLLDLGLAFDSGMPRVTGTGEWVGSPAYMSPEAIAGRRVDERHDVYGLGVTIFEALTGRLPFAAPTREGMFRAILHEPPPALRRLCPAAGADLKLLVATALAKDPARRYQSALDLMGDLGAIRRGAALSVRPPSGAVRVARWLGRNRVASTVGIVLAAGLAGTLFFLQESRAALRRTQALASASAAARAEPDEAIALAAAAVEQLVDPATVSPLQAAVASYHRWQTVATLPSRPLEVTFTSAERIAVRCGEQWMAFGVDGRPVAGDFPPAEALPAGSSGARTSVTLVPAWPDRLIVRSPDRDPIELRVGRRVRTVTVAASGTRLAVLCQDYSIRIYSSEGTDVGAIPFHGVLVHSFAFSPDGRLLASGDGDGVVRIYRDDGQHLHDLGGHGGMVTCVAFGPDGRRIATGSQDATVRVWDVRPVGMIDLNEDWVVSLDRIGDSLLTADASGSVTVYDTRSDVLTRLQASRRVTDAAFAGSRDRVAVCSYGPTEILAPDGGRRELPGVTFQTSIGFADGLLVVGGADGLTGFTATDGDWGRCWSLAVDSGVTAVTVNATTVAAAGDAGWVHLFDRRGVPLRSSFRAHSDRIWSLCFSPGGDLLLTTSRDNWARGWDLDGNLVLDLGDHRHTVSCAAFAPDGAVLATAATDGRVRLWDRTGRELAVLRAHRGQVWGLAFSADGRELFTGSYDRTVRRWPIAVEDLLRLARGLLRR